MNDIGNLLHDYATGKRGATCSHPINMVFSHPSGSEICTACGAELKAKNDRVYTADELKAAVQAEREACAKIAESTRQHYTNDKGEEHVSTVTGLKKRIAAAIRARNGSK